SSIAPSQKATCARPNFAAMPTHVEPTTHKTCAMTRSPSPSSLRRPACSVVVVSGTVNNNATTRLYTAEICAQIRECDATLPVDPARHLQFKLSYRPCVTFFDFPQLSGMQIYAPVGFAFAVGNPEESQFKVGAPEGDEAKEREQHGVNK